MTKRTLRTGSRFHGRETADRITSGLSLEWGRTITVNSSDCQENAKITIYTPKRPVAKHRLAYPPRFVPIKAGNEYMSSKRKSLIPILLLVMIICVVGVVYLATFHTEDMQVVVRHLVTRSLGDHVVIEDIRVGLFPYPHLELAGVRIQGSEQSAPVFQAAHIQLDLNFLSFVQDLPMPNALIIEHADF